MTAFNVTTRPAVPAGHVVGIDALRFAAAMLVMLFHLAAYRLGADPLPAQAQISWAWVGWVGVQIFFVISGYVIAFSAGQATPIAFAFGRLLRLFPLIWICASATLLIGLLLPHALIEVSAVQWLRTVVLMPRAPWIDSVYWTLTVELVFYAVVFATLAWRGAEAVLRVMLVVGLGSCALSLAVLGISHVAPGSAAMTLLRTGQGSGTVTLLLGLHGLYFLLGMLIERSSRMALSRGHVLAALCCLVAGVAQIVDQSARWYPDNLATLPALIWLAAVLALVGTVWTAARSARLPTAVLRLARFAGLLTFPVYLLHYKAGMAIQLALLDTGIDSRWLVAVPVVLMLLLAALAMRVCERPVRRRLAQGTAWLERLLRNRPRLDFLFAGGVGKAGMVQVS